MKAFDLLLKYGVVDKVEFIKTMYESGELNDSQLDVQIDKGLITEDEKIEIVGTPIV